MTTNWEKLGLKCCHKLTFVEKDPNSNSERCALIKCVSCKKMLNPDVIKQEKGLFHCKECNYFVCKKCKHNEETTHDNAYPYNNWPVFKGEEGDSVLDKAIVDNHYADFAWSDDLKKSKRNMKDEVDESHTHTGP